MARFGAALGHWFEPGGFTVQWRELDPGPDGMDVDLAGTRARVVAVDHDETSIALRIEGARSSVAYSGDSDECEALVELCRDVDVAVLECSTRWDRKVPGHLTPREVARIATAAGVGSLVLVHMYPELDEVDLVAAVARFGYCGPVVPATDGYAVEA
jgi:ribonuclease BN (tRNA processing enzyme)